MNKRSSIAVSICASTVLLAFAARAAETNARYSPWWGTDCWFAHPEELTNGLIQSNGYVAFRKFPVSAETVDDSRRSLDVGKLGITIHLGAEKYNRSWRTDHIQFRVAPLGRGGSAVVLTILDNGHAMGDGAFGNMDLRCWRSLEDLIERYAHGTITGSPPRPNLPLHNPTVPEAPQQ
jgi:hypothetical protein